MSRDRLKYISMETLRYILTLVFAAVGTYVGIQSNLTHMKNNIQNTELRVTSIEENIGNTNIGFMYEQHLLQGSYINKLVPNQLSLAKDCGKTVLMHFDNLRGFKMEEKDERKLFY